MHAARRAREEGMNSPSQQVLRLGFGFILSQALRAVAELGIADLFAKGRADGR